MKKTAIAIYAGILTITSCLSPYKIIEMTKIQRSYIENASRENEEHLKSWANDALEESQIILYESAKDSAGLYWASTDTRGIAKYIFEPFNKHHLNRVLFHESLHYLYDKFVKKKRFIELYQEMNEHEYSIKSFIEEQIDKCEERKKDSERFATLGEYLIFSGSKTPSEMKIFLEDIINLKANPHNSIP